MVKKIKTTFSRVSENIFIKYYKAGEKFKDFLSPIFDPENKEKGLALTISTGTLVVAGVIALGGIIWGTWQVKGSLKGAQADFLTSLTLGLGYFLVGIGRAIFGIAAPFLTYVLKPDFFNHAITTDQTFSIVWGSVRDLSNMIIVLGFVVVGIATSLRIREYEAKKILWRLILIALVINFSGLFCGLIIDASNITMNSLLQGGSASQNVDALSGAINNYVEGQLNGTAPSTVGGAAAADVLKNPGTFLFACAMFMVILIFASYTFAIMAILLAARYAILVVLYILSPLAFTFWIFPASRLKKYHSEWWDEFLKWCFVGVFASFFVSLSVKVLLAGNTTGKVDMNVLFVSFFFLIVGYRMIRKTGGIADMASGAIKGLATGGAGLAMGVVAGAGGMAMNRLGRTATGQRTREALSSAAARIQEVTGFAPEGHAAQQKSARERAAATQVNALRTSSAQGDRNRYEQLVRTGQGSMGAAAIATANEHGDLGRFFDANNPAELQRMNNRVANAQAFGHERSEFEKKNYQLRGLNQGAVSDYQTAHPGTSTADAQEAVVREQLAANLPQMTTPELGRIDHRHVTGAAGSANYEFVRDNFTPRMISQLRVSPNRPLITAMKSHLGAAGVAGTLIGDRDAAVAARNMAEANRLQRAIDEINRLP